MAFCGCKSTIFQNGSDKFVVKSKHFEKEFAIFNMITFLVSVKLNGIGHQLFLIYILEDQEIRVIFVIMVSSLIWTLAIEEATSTMCPA